MFALWHNFAQPPICRNSLCPLAILVLLFHGYSNTTPAEMFGRLLLLLRSFNLGLQATDHPDPAALQKVQAAEPGAVDPLTGEPTYWVRPADDIPKLRAI